LRRIRQSKGGGAGNRRFGIGGTFKTLAGKSAIGNGGVIVVQRQAPAGLDTAAKVIGILLALQSGMRAA
jgi:hypothetical protein